MRRPLVTGESAPQTAYAAVAAATARSTSSLPAAATLARRIPVAGLVTSKLAPSAAATRSPPIRRPSTVVLMPPPAGTCAPG